MKIYAIEYVKNDDWFKFYIITDRFLSERKEITEEFYFDLVGSFRLPDKNNNSKQGRYFETGAI